MLHWSRPAQGKMRLNHRLPVLVACVCFKYISTHPNILGCLMHLPAARNMQENSALWRVVTAAAQLPALWSRNAFDVSNISRLRILLRAHTWRLFLDNGIMSVYFQVARNLLARVLDRRTQPEMVGHELWLDGTADESHDALPLCVKRGIQFITNDFLESA